MLYLSLLRKENGTEKKYWLSLEDWAGSEEFKKSSEKEFVKPLPTEGEGWSRREFLKLMGASFA